MSEFNFIYDLSNFSTDESFNLDDLNRTSKVIKTEFSINYIMHSNLTDNHNFLAEHRLRHLILLFSANRGSALL